MEEFKFKVGDRVKILTVPKFAKKLHYVSSMSRYGGDIAEITSRHYDGDYELFYSLKNIPYYWHESLLEVIKNEIKIVITTDGTTTRAALYDGHNFIREAKAICGKDDVFDFKTGAKIAFERLTNDNEPSQKEKLKPLNTRIFVIDGLNDFKSGHIYEIKDGKINCGDGWQYPIKGKLYNMNDVYKYFNGKNDIKYNAVGEIMGGFNTTRRVKIMEVKEEGDSE